MKKKPFRLLPMLMLTLLCGCMDIESGAYEKQGNIAAVQVLATAETGMDSFFAENADDYFWYMNEKEYADLMESYYGEYDGIGITMLAVKDKSYPLITAVSRNSPAKEQGLKVGEYIKSVNGEDIADWSLDDISDKVRGKAGTEVIITVEDTEGKERQVRLTRRKIENYSVETRELEGYPQIAYIAISTFSENTPGEFRELWQELLKERKIEGLIIDLRDNSGGSFPASINLASYFIPKGEPVVYQKTRKGLIYEESKGSMSISQPVIILQNGYSASASEVFIGAMHDYEIASTVGELSYGKGITQTIISMLSGNGYRYTASMYYTPNMFSLHGVGLTPDYEIPINEECGYEDIIAADYSKDNQLAKAIELLLE